MRGRRLGRHGSHAHRAAVALAVIVGCLLFAAPAFAEEKSSQTIEFKSTPPNPGLVGETYEVKAEAKTSVSFGSLTTSVCTVSGSTVKFISAGSCEVEAKAAETAEWQAASAKQSITVSKRPQTVKFTSTPPKPGLVGGTYEVTAEAKTSVSFGSLTTSVCTVSGSTVEFITAGSCEVEAKAAETGEWQAASKKQSITVGKRSQTIEFKSTPPNPGFVGETYEVKAEAKTSVSFSSLTTSVCTVSGPTVEFIAAGKCEVEAKAAESPEWEAASKPQSISVAKRSQSVKFTSAAPSPGLVGGTYPLAARAESTLPVVIESQAPQACEVTPGGESVHLIAVGACKLLATQAGNGTWERATQTQEFAVVARSQSISFSSSPPNPGTVGGSYTVSATATSKLPVSFSSSTPSICSVSGNSVSLAATGTCTIVAHQPGNGEYSEASTEQQSFVVVPAVAAAATPAPVTKVTTVVIIPDSTFKVVGATLNLRNFQITFTESVHDPGTFSWLLTFKNGLFGVFGTSSALQKKCRAGYIRLKGRCRPEKISFSKGSQTVTTAGNVSFTVVPTAAAVRALKTALKHKQSLPVMATVTYQSVHGGQPVSHLQKLVVKLSK